MDAAVNLGREEVLEHFQCVICLEDLENIKVCPHCSCVFCDACIKQWLEDNTKCPHCASAVNYAALVQGCLISQIQESLKKLFSVMDNKDNKDHLCDKHDTRQLSMFCFACEVTICVQCLYLDDHNEHREQVELLEEAFEHFKQSLKVALTWIGKRKEVIEQIQNELSDEKKEIERLCQSSAELLAGTANPKTVRQIFETDRDMEKLRSTHQDDTKSIRLDRRREFMSEPTILVFRMPTFDNVIKDHGSYETNLRAPHGFEWKCKIANEDGTLFFYLCLIAGKVGDYSVQFDNVLEKVDRYELENYVKIGAYQPVASGENYAQELTVHIRQTYADKIQQQQDYIDRLEKENAQYMALKTFLANLEKKGEPSCN